MDFNFSPFIKFIDYGLYALLLIVTSFVLYWLMGSDIRVRLTHYKYRLRLKRQHIKRKEEKIPQSKWFRHLYKLFAIRSEKADVVTVYGFIFAEVFIAVGMFIVVVIQLQDAIIGLICAMIVLLIPYVYLIVRARNIQSEIGSGIQTLVQTLVHSYSAVQGDMYAALNMTHNQIKQKELRRVLARLISDLQTAHDEKTLREIVDFFIFTTGNSWGMRLGNIILKAYIYQENVNTALLTLQKQITTHQKMIEEEKADAVDLSLQAMIALIIFPISLLGANYITKPQNWWVLQFKEPFAFLTFVITFLFVLISGLIAYVIRKPKIDL